ncbi:MAG: hypothetical protein V4547_16435 [Bacteroidota bacterium]
MAIKKLSGSLALTKLQHVILEKKGKTGMIKGLFIPIEANMLVVGKEKDGVSPIYMPVNLQINDEQNEHGQNGFIAKTIDSKVWKEMTPEQKEDSKKLSPILGNVKDWGSGGGDDAAGDAGGGTVFNEEEHDDLPF